MEYGYQKFIVGPVMSNAHLFYNKKTGNAILFDIGGNPSPVVRFLEENDLNLQYIFLTHGHGDHILGIEALQSKTNAKSVGYIKEMDFFQKPEYNLSGMMGKRVGFTPDIVFEEDGKLQLGDWNMHIYHTPGHTPGSVCILMGDYLITGDTLFRGSIGRTDLIGGNMDDMMESLKLFKEFKGDTIIFPGHEENSTIREELEHNPYLRFLK